MNQFITPSASPRHAPLEDRIESIELRSRVMSADEAVKFVPDQAILAVSGFTKSGDPKTVLPALANDFATRRPHARVALYSGASLSDQAESPLSPFIAKRAPYMSSDATRKRILAGEMEFNDIHLSGFARNLMYGFYGEIDCAIVEVSRIRSNGTAVLTTSVGISAEALAKAKSIIFEVNTAMPDFTGFHDIALPGVYPQSNWPLPLLNVGDRIGSPYVSFDPKKVVAIVESRVPDHPVAFKDTTDIDRKIAANVIDFLLTCQKKFDWGDRLPPIQSGVGNIANAVVAELNSSPFRKLRFWTEVFQDGMLRCMEDADKLESASATAVSLSAQGQTFFEKNLSTCRDRLVLRPMWLSNSPELVTRLFVIALNTPIEVDIYGHVNSTHVDGSRIINGLGGSGDFLRNAYLSVVHTPSIRKMKDGRTVSCIMPYVRHIDHTEHDIKCVITEHGYAVSTDILAPRKRAHAIIESCAHPYFRPLLHEYITVAGPGDEPRPTDMAALQNWWRTYEEACKTF